MGSNVVIVAIPDENDRVWKISSEKIPHLTLLFLGDGDQVANLDQIMLFTEHAVNTTLRRFYLPVDRRGELGDDQADVLFFKKDRYDYKAVRDFRVQLLQNDSIRTAYDSASQFEGPWTPHLTLGYPTQPAKPDDDGYGFYDVNFNKIAVWTGDYEGVDFLLKDRWDELDALDAVPMDVAMSDLEHFGTKGMKWGVRKAKEAGKAVGRGARAVGRGLEKMGANLADSSWQQSTYSDVKHEAVHNHVAKELDNRVERLQRSPKYRGKDLKADRDLRHEYRQDVAKVSTAAYRRAVKETYGENYTGTKSANYMTDARGPRIEVRNKKTKELESEAPLTSKKEIKKRRAAEAATFGHADISEAPDLVIELKHDDNDQIIGVGFIPVTEDDAMAQSIELGEEFILEHFGIRGMKWGVRKPPPAAVSPTAMSKIPQSSRRKTKIKTEGGENHPAHTDALVVAEAKAKLKKSGPSALSNSELREVANRIQLENQVNLLTSSKGKKFVSQEFENESKKLAKKGVWKGAGAAAKSKSGRAVTKSVTKKAATVATTAALMV